MYIENIWQEYWKRHKNHSFGMCYANHDLKKFYINIPKNATNWGKSAMMDINWTQTNYHRKKLIKQGYDAIVILRDPIDRWFSGIAEFGNRYNIKFNPKQMTRLTTRLLTDRVAFDEHTEEQCMFLEGINQDTATFFKFGPDLNQNFSDYLRKVLGIENSLSGKPPAYISRGSKEYIKSMFEELLTEDDFKRLRLFYELDYDLYNNVKYYKRKED